MQVRIAPFGDAAVLVQVGERIEEQTFRRVAAVVAHLEAHPFAGLVELVPAFTTVTVYYDPLQAMTGLAGEGLPAEKVVRLLEQMLAAVEESQEVAAEVVEIPVCYGGEHGPDLEAVAKHCGLSAEEVVAIHAGGEYLVHMIGFAPGFPYLGGMSEKIATPRRSSPRARIPVGSVGIAGNQTGVYPLETPGGWQLIGRTPVQLFRPEGSPPSLLTAGNRVKFRPISEREFAEMERG